MMPDEVLVKFVAGVIIVAGHASHDACLFEVAEVAVDRTLRETPPMLAQFGHGCGPPDTQQRFDELSSTTRVNQAT